VAKVRTEQLPAKADEPMPCSPTELVRRRIRERSRLLSWLWVVSDCGYYLGLVGAAFALSMACGIVVVAGFGRLVAPDDERAVAYWSLLPFCVVSFPIFLGVSFAAAFLKAGARRWSGIHDGDQASGQDRQSE
jgi:hypothetical protein